MAILTWLICGGIGGGARNALAEAGIKLFPGAQGDADAQVESYLAGTLNYDRTRCARIMTTAMETAADMGMASADIIADRDMAGRWHK